MHLGSAQTKGRKDTQNRRAIIYALLSHAIAWRSLPARQSILSSLAGVHDNSIFRGVLPLLSPLAENKSDEASWLTLKLGREQGEYLSLLFDTLQKGTASILADPNAEPWKFLLSLLSPLEGSGTSSGVRMDWRHA
jgi:U3 small nucleolar RNA-associated protein 10